MTLSETVTEDEPTRVFLLIENRLVRETLVRLFRKRSGLCVVGEGCSTEATDVLDSHCDILVLDDLQMPSPPGARFLDGRETNRTMGIVLIGMEEDEKQFLLVVRSGISAYLLNDASATDAVTAVRAARPAGRPFALPGCASRFFMWWLSILGTRRLRLSRNLRPASRSVSSSSLFLLSPRD